MSINASPLPDEILKKICHHMACIYKDLLPTKNAYNCFMEISLRVAARFAEEALFDQKYAAGSMGIAISDMCSTKLHKIIYYSVLSDMTNSDKFQKSFSNYAQVYSIQEPQRIVADNIISEMVNTL